MSGNLDDMKLEELHDRLTEIEKDNEQIRRENQLFESYITRKMKEKESDPNYQSEDTFYLRAKMNHRPIMELRLVVDER